MLFFMFSSLFLGFEAMLLERTVQEPAFERTFAEVSLNEIAAAVWLMITGRTQLGIQLSVYLRRYTKY